jgi:hypothetical protein
MLATKVLGSFKTHQAMDFRIMVNNWHHQPNSIYIVLLPWRWPHRLGRLLAIGICLQFGDLTPGEET